MGSRRIGHARMQALINKNLNQFEFNAPITIEKIKLYPADPTSSLVTSDTTFTANDSGKIILIDASSAANLTMTLPSGEVGMHFTFMLVSNSNAASEVLIDGGSGVNIRGISTGVGNATYVNINSRTVGLLMLKNEEQ